MDFCAFSQILVLLLAIGFYRCEGTGASGKEGFRLPNSDRVLENGRIISKTVGNILDSSRFTARFCSCLQIEQPMPVDQRPLPMIQSDDTNPKALKYVAYGDILVPNDPVDRKR